MTKVAGTFHVPSARLTTTNTGYGTCKVPATLQIIETEAP